MKNLLLTTTIGLLINMNALSQTNSVEGKWVVEDYPNTMYILENGIKYTYHCVSVSNCDSLYATYQAGDGNHNPGTNSYTYANDSLIIDLNFGNYFEEAVTFECQDNIIDFGSLQSRWIRVGTDLSDCGTAGINENTTDLNGRKLIKVVDLLGRETVIDPNVLLIHIYDDGSSEKRVVID